MPRTFGEPLTRLRAIPIEDNGEPLCDPRTLSRRIHFAATHPRFPQMRRSPRVRQRVAEMLALAAECLPEGIDLKIIKGFRPLSQQRFMYEALMEEFAREHPQWGRPVLVRYTNRISAPPDDKCPPPHSTGGAVDLNLCRANTGAYLDMTSPYPWSEESAPTIVPGLSPQAQANRRLLAEILEKVDLTNYAGEWWHWSYGDSGWALRTGAPKALYDRTEADGTGRRKAARGRLLPA